MRVKKYDQDLIHFHTFLANERVRKSVTQTNLCRGLCSISMMARIESGERLPDKLLRDRFLGRLGVAREGYEDYLQPGEYAIWEQKQKIIYDFEHGMPEQAHREVTELLQSADKGNRVCRQFCLVMEAVLLQKGNGDRRETAGYMERAKELTMPEVQFGKLQNYILSAQEIYILIKLLEYKESVVETDGTEKTKPDGMDIEKAYIELLDYVRGSFLDDLEKVKVYPIIVVQYDRYLRRKGMQHMILRFLSEACEYAMQLYRSTARMYYLVEILELRTELLKQKIDLQGTGKEAKEKLCSELAQNDSWYQAITTIYRRYDVEAEMTSDLYLYKDTETYCISTVIHDRRMMLGYSIAELADGICSEKTLRRIESGKVNAQMPIVLEIFERLGLSGEYTRAEVICYDHEAEKLVDDMAYKMNECEYDRAMQDLDELEKILPKNTLNEQFCICHRNTIRYRLKQIDQKEHQKNMIEALAITVPFDRIQMSNRVFLTNQETIYIYNIANKLEEPDLKKYTEILMKQLKTENEYLKEIHILLYELIMTWMASNEGNLGYYDYSDQISKETICVCLQMKRMNMITKNLFNNIWNYLEKNGENAKKNCVVAELKCCIVFSQLWGDSAFEKFCTEKLKMFNDGLLHL